MMIIIIIIVSNYDRLIMRSELNGRNKIEAINSLAIPTVQYSFGIIDWKYSELKKLDSKTRKILTMHGMLHQKSDVDRIYIPRKEAGRGLIEIETAFKVAIVGLNHYLENKSTLSSNMIIMHEKTKAKNSISKIAKNIEKEMADLNFAPKPDKPTAENAKALKQEMKKELVKKKIIDGSVNHCMESTLHLLGSHMLTFQIQIIGSDQTSKEKQRDY